MSDKVVLDPNFLAIGSLELECDSVILPQLTGHEAELAGTIQASGWRWVIAPKKLRKVSKASSLVDALLFIIACQVAAAQFRIIRIGDPGDQESTGGTQASAPCSFDETLRVFLHVRLFLLPVDAGARKHLSSLSNAKGKAYAKSLQYVLLNVDCNREAWHIGPIAQKQGMFVSEPRTANLSKVYADMPSPRPWKLRSEIADAGSLSLLQECTIRDAPRGMRTTLYAYQKNSLWKLVQRETFPQRVLDPDMFQRRTPDTDTEYYICLSTWEIHRYPVFYEETPSGIICEGMGVGKTCICLALILHTKHQSSKAPVDCTGGNARVDLHPELLRLMGGEPDDQFPSLKSLCARQVLLSRVPFRGARDRLGPYMYSLLKKSSPYYLKEPRQQWRYSYRSEKAADSIKMLLSSATLVVVPDTLVVQWQVELNKHVADGALEVLIVADAKMNLPDPVTLLEYDIVLMSHSRFGLENQPSEKWDINGNLVKSPLLMIRWLRLIFDEGHNMGQRKLANNQVGMAARLECDRVWICTGTPMPNALRAVGNEEERFDLDRLGGLVTECLRIEPFASSPGLFTKVITKPFLQGGFRGFEKLQSLMHRIMIRNRPADVALDVVLPPLHQRIVCLDFNRHQRLVHNCLIALIGSNAVLSQRQHQDYFFHPSNAQALRAVTTNLFSSCFWFGGRVLRDNVVSALKNVDEGLEKTVERGFSAADTAQLQSIREHLAEALSDSLWNRIVDTDDVVYEVSGWPKMLNDMEPDAAMLTFVNKLLPSTSLVHAKDIEALQKHQLKSSVDGQVTKLDTFILSTSSTKLSYIADELLKHAFTEKTIIFGQSDRELYYCRELCGVLRIRCLLFHKSMKVSERAHNITTFNTSENVSVLIMDVRLGAWGIDLSSASRVYFLSPVWHQDVESQAIKRAHRIGSKRAVYVETLVINGTVEEDVMSRRKELANKAGQSRHVTDDGKMRNILSRGSFIQPSESTQCFHLMKRPCPVMPAKRGYALIDVPSLTMRSSTCVGHNELEAFSEMQRKKVRQDV
ncbi:SNF2 family N-terminal domain-containing protein [Gaertneriomyces semiglobifer]|nr:SNF2 family N-terminal domain-containing protein [Gaertneriomyces semiglobifer]